MADPRLPCRHQPRPRFRWPKAALAACRAPPIRPSGCGLPMAPRCSAAARGPPRRARIWLTAPAAATTPRITASTGQPAVAGHHLRGDGDQLRAGQPQAVWRTRARPAAVSTRPANPPPKGSAVVTDKGLSAPRSSLRVWPGPSRRPYPGKDVGMRGAAPARRTDPANRMALDLARAQRRSAIACGDAQVPTPRLERGPPRRQQLWLTRWSCRRRPSSLVDRRPGRSAPASSQNSAPGRA